MGDFGGGGGALNKYLSSLKREDERRHLMQLTESSIRFEFSNNV